MRTLRNIIPIARDYSRASKQRRHRNGEQRLLWPKIEQFVTVITAKARHSGYTTTRLHDGKGKTMIKIILSVVAAVFVVLGALAITDAGDDKSSALL
jgi:hypothetical protein